MAIEVAVFIGSLRTGSINRLLARAIETMLPAHLHCAHVPIGNLPLYNQDFESALPAAALQLKSQIESADALLFVTPEYNRSIPGVLKNAIDTASRPPARNAFAGKPAAVLGASTGAPGTAMAQQHLRNVLAYLDVPVLGQPEVFLQFREGLIDTEGEVQVDSTRAFLQGFADRYVDWVERFIPTHQEH